MFPYKVTNIVQFAWIYHTKIEKICFCNQRKPEKGSKLKVYFAMLSQWALTGAPGGTTGGLYIYRLQVLV